MKARTALARTTIIRALACVYGLAQVSALNGAPTQVLKFSPAAAGEARLLEVYLDGGEQLSAGSVAATTPRPATSAR